LPTGLKQGAHRSGMRPSGTAFLLPAAAAFGCAPSLNVLGVYFPGWLVSSVVGLVVAYSLVWWLGRRPRQRALAQSGLLFCSLTVMVALLVWWIFFSGF
jgi:Flp pilus assembly protein TadB